MKNQPMNRIALGAAALLLALVARADLDYADKPLFYASGVQPNVALIIDNSISMGAADTGSTFPYTNVCASGTVTVTGTGQITRMEAAQQAACQVVQDNANSMRIGLYRFDGGAGGNAYRLVNFGGNIPTIKTAIDGMNNDQNTPLGSSMQELVTDYLSSTSPIQYRCQKNYIVFFTDGEPNTGIDENSSIAYPSTSTSQQSPWPLSSSSAGSSSSSPGWDGYTDGTYIGGQNTTVRPWLDDLAQFAYDVDMKTASSAATPLAVCGDAASSAGEDCAGKSWDDPDFLQQNVVTYTVGLGAEANNMLLRNAPLVDRHTVASADVDIGADTIAWPSHGLADGQYVHYYAAYADVSHSTTATANTGTDVLSGNTLNMVANDALAYDNGGGAQLQYRVITTPAVAAANCGNIGGLTSGNNYYVAYRSATELRLATNSANAYLSAALADAAGTVSDYTIDLTSTGTLNTTHAFTRTNASAGFISTGAGTSPVDVSLNVKKITRTAHGLNTGDVVTYTCTGAGCAIAPLVSGNTYFVARRTADQFRLATSALLAASCAAANDGIATVGTSCINLTGRGSAGGVQTFTKTATATATSFTATGAGTVPVRTTADYEKITATSNHGFSTGDRVTYTCSNFAGTPAVYTDYDLPATVYARTVVAGNPGTFQVSLTSGGAALDLGTSAGTAAQTFSWTRYDVAQTAIGGLYPYENDATPDATPSPATESDAKGKYYVNALDEDTIQLYLPARYGFSPVQAIKATFSGSNASTSATSKKITLSHKFITGDAVTYTCPNGCTAPLTNNTTYYVGVVDADEIRLSTTLANAAGCATGTTGCISFTATDSDLQYLSYTPSTPTAVNFTSAGSGVLSAGPGKSYFAATAAELSGALTSAFTEIRAQELSFASLASNSSELTAGSRLYQARFNTADWSGDVRALTIVGGMVDENNPDWRAYQKLPTAASRNILTRNDTNGAFTFTTGANWSKLTSAQQTSLGNGGAQAIGEAVINWTRGEVVSTYRTRANGNIGDILNSSLVYVGQPAEDYANLVGGLPSSDPAKASYVTFKSNTRTPMVYGGSNGGMLHGFEASNNVVSKGVEKVAFIPEGVYMDWVDADNDGVKDAGEAAINKFWDVARPYYGLVTSQPHHYFVDGTPTTGDVYFDDFAKADIAINEWHTVLVGGLGKGGRSVYALDVTDGNFDVDDVLWEFKGSGGKMGYSYSRPVIARLSNGEWVAIFGNGYDSVGDQARLFIVDIEDGSLIQEIVLGTAGGNGLSSVSVLRSNTDADGVTALRVYAGDLQGNVWKVDISNALALPTSVATPFFVAQDQFGNRQPITSEITLQRYDDLDALDAAAPEGGVMLFFGTGSYFTTGDMSYDYPSTGPQYHAMYGIWDKGDVSSVALTSLQEQTMGTAIVNSVSYRTASANVVSYDGSPPPVERGWYMKLAVTDPTDVFRGELAVFSPTAVGTYLVFSTITPADADACESGGSGSLYVVNALTGGANAYSPFDLDDDGDNMDENAAVIGLDFGDVLLSKPLVLEDVNDSIDGDKSICVGKSDGSVECQDLFDPPGPPATSNLNSGRMSWRQLQ